MWTPILFAEVIASNVGGTATLVGDPPNIIIGSAAGLSYGDFVAAMAPLVVLLLMEQGIVIHFIWGRRLTAAREDRERVLAMDARREIRDVWLLRRSLGVIVGVTVAFVVAPAVHVEPGTVAMMGVAALLLLETWGLPPEQQSRRVQAGFADVQWVTLFFFVGLFIVVAGVKRAGLLDIVGARFLALTGGNVAGTAITVL